MLLENPTFISHYQFFVGLVIGLTLGLAVGYIIALRSKKPESKITAVQLLAVLTLFGYLLVSFAFEKDVSWVIAVAILATGYGARGGEILEKVLEKREQK